MSAVAVAVASEEAASDVWDMGDAGNVSNIVGGIRGVGALGMVGDGFSDRVVGCP